MSEFYLDSGKSGDIDACKSCVAAHKAWISHDEVAKYHCYSCNVCSVKDMNVEDFDNQDVIVDMDNGLDVCTRTFSNLGGFVWLCSRCLNNVKEMKNCFKCE